MGQGRLGYSRVPGVSECLRGIGMNSFHGDFPSISGFTGFPSLAGHDAGQTQIQIVTRLVRCLETLFRHRRGQQGVAAENSLAFLPA